MARRMYNWRSTIRTQPINKGKIKRVETALRWHSIIPKRNRVKTILKNMRQRLHRTRATRTRRIKINTTMKKSRSNRHTIMVTLPREKLYPRNSQGMAKPSRTTKAIQTIRRLTSNLVSLPQTEGSIHRIPNNAILQVTQSTHINAFNLSTNRRRENNRQLTKIPKTSTLNEITNSKS